MPSSGVQTCALDRKSTRLNSSHTIISYTVFCLKKNVKQGLTAGLANSHNCPIDVDHSPRRPTRCAQFPTHAVHSAGGPKESRHFFFFFNDQAPEILSPFPLPRPFPT